eukprot:CAMPEP_0178912494 /NCGR_PEP_ID=MMETSP0786-20121207/10297_1 /TAXON_ID=186022 /ORGANISM="Thalassionema frauenfeldii, Strain CCMP 1798" /LENGTH=287 /DNA_ID=CAMNT_0020585089 /DNA_START=55 /DNA_END=918 /DNA_ORIENTATION=+
MASAWTLILLFCLSTSRDGASAFFFPKPHVRVQPNVLFMGWGPDPIWSSAKLTVNEAACKSEASVCLEVELENEESSKEYKVPGQYVQLRLDEDTKPLFLAISSPPNEESNVFEFLVKKTEGNEWLTSASSGSAVEISQVLGDGFPIDENLDSLKYDFPTQNIILLAAGSGIAPIKAAMDSGLLKTDEKGGRTARLYYGERTPDDLCFVEEFVKWEAAGFEVVPVISQPPDEWKGRSGYVQNALEEDGVPIPRNSGALLCGMKEMAESVKDILTKAGTFEGRVLTNF